MNISHVILNQILFFFFTSIHRHLIITQPPSVTKSVHPITRTQNHAELRKFYHRQHNSTRLQWKVPWHTIHRGLILATHNTNTFNDRRIFSTNFLHTRSKTILNTNKSNSYYTNSIQTSTKKLIMTSHTSSKYLEKYTGHHTRAGNISATYISDQPKSERKQSETAPFETKTSPTNNRINNTGINLSSATISQTGSAIDEDQPSDINNHGIHV